ncbi:hypothetical protein PIIN_09807 [Serendipita indica DSM 11827]|uniref:Uncharacterized protein n=1 Tax=Serendipita indica (strain DSM 11827) TaxID=1109443 RepID=G4TWX6_SERID|nr:hypothetical protein PIIN_09807 [Serendipita indica DSM 11827]
MDTTLDDTRTLSDQVEMSPNISSPPAFVLYMDPESPSDATDVLAFEGDGPLSDSDSAQEPVFMPDSTPSLSSGLTSALDTLPPSTPNYPASVSSNATPPPASPSPGSLSPVSEMSSETSSEDNQEGFEEDVVEGAIQRLSAMSNTASED